MAPRIIYSDNPSPNINKAPNTPDVTISVVANNVSFRSFFPNHQQNEVLLDFANFLSSCRLRYALTDVPMYFYPKQVCEFYSTCTYDLTTNLIYGTIADGSRNVTISIANIRAALRLPQLDAYSDLPTDTQCRNLLPKLGYDETLGNRPHLVLSQCLPPAWKYFTGVIGKCLGHKTSSLDQLNSYELKLLFCLVYNKRTDYAKLIFDHLVDLISGPRRSNYVPFPRWIALVLEYFHQGYNINSGPECDVPTLSSRIIQDLPGPDDVYMTQKMFDWIENPYEADPTALPPPEDNLLDAQADDQNADQDQNMEESDSSSYHSYATARVSVSASQSSDQDQIMQDADPQEAE